MPLGDGTGPNGTGPRGSGRGLGKGICRSSAADYRGLDEKTFLENTISRLEAQLQMYKKRLEELK
ncbi:MAG TPA: DUF5320 domain-containing protein [Candidatus Methanofastidiosa archaeon]|nr:DUF5320 domain-containing protein [Candidatus Methanofastidiosa archaeon]HPR41759.1 DUF5320 domain-containing protein [Candidatus Methanofastidiosa archaeon]